MTAFIEEKFDYFVHQVIVNKISSGDLNTNNDALNCKHESLQYVLSTQSWHCEGHKVFTLVTIRLQANNTNLVHGSHTLVQHVKHLCAQDQMTISFSTALQMDCSPSSTEMEINCPAGQLISISVDDGEQSIWGWVAYFFQLDTYGTISSLQHG